MTQFEYEFNGFVTEGIGAKAAMKGQGFYPRSGQLPVDEQLWESELGGSGCGEQEKRRRYSSCFL